MCVQCKTDRQIEVIRVKGVTVREQGEMVGERVRWEEWGVGGGASEGEEECQQKRGTMGGVNKDYVYV